MILIKLGRTLLSYESEYRGLNVLQRAIASQNANVMTHWVHKRLREIPFEIAPESFDPNLLCQELELLACLLSNANWHSEAPEDAWVESYGAFCASLREIIEFYAKRYNQTT